MMDLLYNYQGILSPHKTPPQKKNSNIIHGTIENVRYKQVSFVDRCFYGQVCVYILYYILFSDASSFF